MKKRIICGSAAILLTGLSAAMFSAAASRSHEQAAPAIETPRQVIETVVVERGRYLARTAGCNDCHTPGYAGSGGAVPETNWLVGDSIGWQGAWGTTYPINLRLFMQQLTPEQWLIVARKPARPPMPWFALRDMTDQDLLAIYHYVRSLGPAGEAAPSYLPPGEVSATPVVKFPG
ncbi:mono/diheme cytochrome c family protein [Povalibacter uvarum]|uniref:Mono/diheme cytochrome c family protein n=1 Tax=Povalibacter uvarum TaxID=732238 RepID=A0A841HNL7_9GAMM|nr:c-type cytochrome [Povalibacter uvarum]MBB6094466.1 mono/diheme cytochrome c family protein [Povalibacter uvarum]